MSKTINVVNKTLSPPQPDLRDKSIVEEDFFDCTHLIEKLNNKEFKASDWNTAFEEHIAKHDRIFYSKVSLYVYEIAQVEETDRILSNLQIAINGMKEKEEHDNVGFRKIALKLYDHINLAIQQAQFIQRKSDFILHDVESKAQQSFEAFDKKMSAQVEELNVISQKVKDSEKNYITILGIFAAIVITFTAGSIFSSSVLENIHKVSAYRLISTTIIIGCMLTNTLFALFYFIKQVSINAERSWSTGFIWATNIFCAILLAIVFCSWHFGFIEARDKRILAVEPKNKCPQTAIYKEALKDTCSSCR